LGLALRDEGAVADYRDPAAGSGHFVVTPDREKPHPHRMRLFSTIDSEYQVDAQTRPKFLVCKLPAMSKSDFGEAVEP
jgi:hypothetical protein